MYRIVGDERIESIMPLSSVERARHKGWLECETAQRLDMPMEIQQMIMTKAVEPIPEAPEQIEVAPEVEGAIAVDAPMPTIESKPKTQRNGRKK